MATLNVTVPDTGWVQVASDADAGFLAQGGGSYALEWATTASAAPPAVRGFVLPAASLVGRGLLGPGFVWVRQYPGGTGYPVTLTVSR